MGAPLELDGAIRVRRLGAGVLRGQPKVAGGATVDARYRLMCDLGLAAAASAKKVRAIVDRWLLHNLL